MNRSVAGSSWVASLSVLAFAGLGLAACPGDVADPSTPDGTIEVLDDTVVGQDTVSPDTSADQAGSDGSGDISGPDVTGDTSQPDATPTDATSGKGLGEACGAPTECQSGLCVAGRVGDVCGTPCDQGGGCPAGWYCDEAGSECSPLHATLCDPCTGADQDECGPPASGARCVQFGDEATFCATSCVGGCPTGHECGVVTLLDGTTAERCAPQGGALCTCDDAAVAAAAQTLCGVTNGQGRCGGTRTCEAGGGLSACTAAIPEAEVCGGGDENCDGTVDEEDALSCTAFYKDFDSDLLGIDGDTHCTCAAGDVNYYGATQLGDCDDSDASIGKCVVYFADADGDGVGDENDTQCLCVPVAPYTATVPGCDVGGVVTPCTVYYADDDEDGFGDPNDSLCLCSADDTYSTEDDTDCDDGETSVGACAIYYKDGDLDDAGLTDDSKCLCAPTAPYTASVGGDCDDTEALTKPGLEEACGDGVDNDCDGIIDEEDAVGCTPYYLDGDGDDFGVDGQVKCLCAAWNNYDAVKGGDCNDLDPLTYPGQPCGAVSCTYFILSGQCDAGTCGPGGEAAPCTGNFACADATSCRTSCSDKTQCAPGYYCDGGGACVGETPDGGACGGDTECGSDHCGGGFCCAFGKCCDGSDGTCDDGNSCTDTSCNANFECLTSNNTVVCATPNCSGGEFVEEMTCQNGSCVGGGATQDCSIADSVCVAGTCDANGGCGTEPIASGTECQAAGCIGWEEITAKACDGAGGCNQGGASTICANNFACNGAGTKCRTGCNKDSQCQPDAYCSGNSCVTQKDVGDSCNDDAECYLSTCQGGFCCDGCCDYGTAGSTEYPRTMEICGETNYSTEGIAACKRSTGSFGANDFVMGESMVQISTGIPNQTADQEWDGEDNGNSGSDPDGSTSADVNDLCGFTLDLVVPPEARGLAFDFIFFSAEYPEWVGDEYNDSFNVILTSQNYNGNISFDGGGNAISINNVLFDPTLTAELVGTGYGGGIGGTTGWLTTTVPVVPGETITLRFVIYDEGDSIFDSDALIDNFRWLEVQPGTGPVTQ